MALALVMTDELAEMISNVERQHSLITMELNDEEYYEERAAACRTRAEQARVDLAAAQIALADRLVGVEPTEVTIGGSETPPFEIGDQVEIVRPYNYNGDSLHHVDVGDVGSITFVYYDNDIDVMVPGKGLAVMSPDNVRRV